MIEAIDKLVRLAILALMISLAIEYWQARVLKWQVQRKIYQQFKDRGLDNETIVRLMQNIIIGGEKLL